MNKNINELLIASEDARGVREGGNIAVYKSVVHVAIAFVVGLAWEEVAQRLHFPVPLSIIGLTLFCWCAVHLRASRARHMELRIDEWAMRRKHVRTILAMEDDYKRMPTFREWLVALQKRDRVRHFTCGDYLQYVKVPRGALIVKQGHEPWHIYFHGIRADDEVVDGGEIDGRLTVVFGDRRANSGHTVHIYFDGKRVENDELERRLIQGFTVEVGDYHLTYCKKMLEVMMTHDETNPTT